MKDFLALVGAAALATIVASPTRASEETARLAAPPPIVVEARLEDHRGRSQRFRRDVLGKALTLVSFTFVGCTVQCPISDTYMTLVEDELTRAGRQDVRLVTLTINPDNRPDDLKAHAAQFDPGPFRLFLTGGFSELMPLLDGLGMRFGSASDHPFFYLVFDARGGFIGRVEEKDASPEVLLARLGGLARQ
ncbi:SCO family protein [uncultured Enterovirga sp.]|uniref:SCO family protein n=1 Tax=uncultured Enterovirga sp. TaxID=2026352 RepID=UPI0035CBA329